MNKNAYFEEMKKRITDCTIGQRKALIEYRRNLEHDVDVFEVEELPWQYELSDFIEALRKADVTKIVVTDKSTGLMDGIYGLTDLGCRMQGLNAGNQERGILFEI